MKGKTREREGRMRKPGRTCEQRIKGVLYLIQKKDG